MAAKILRGAPLQGVLDSRNPTADALQEMANTSSGPYVGGGGAPQAS